MCGICGCSELELNHVHEHSHGDVQHTHKDDLIHIEENILEKNKQFAQHNQRQFNKNNILAFNIMSSPGSGKTTLLCKTITDLDKDFDISVVVGDQETNFDAELIKSSGGNAIQVNTGKICHLDAHMVGHALQDISIKEKSILFIENVGNLVCPALFALGEHFKIVILSVTEGDNKPLKYPDMFRSADLMIITKMDLLPYVDFDLDKCIAYARRINAKIDTLALSATRDLGLSDWYQWLCQKLNK